MRMTERAYAIDMFCVIAYQPEEAQNRHEGMLLVKQAEVWYNRTAFLQTGKECLN